MADNKNEKKSVYKDKEEEELFREFTSDYDKEDHIRTKIVTRWTSNGWRECEETYYGPEEDPVVPKEDHVNMPFRLYNRKSKLSIAPGNSLILLFIAGIFAAAALSAAIWSVSSLGVISRALQGNYNEVDEAALQSLAAERYKESFPEDPYYEKNISLVILTSGNKKDYHCAGVSGKEVPESVARLIGGEGSYLDLALRNSLNAENYEGTLGDDLASAVELLEEKICSVNGTSSDSSILVNGKPLKKTTSFVNESELDISASRLKTALGQFTDATGFGIRITVMEAEDVVSLNYPLLILPFVVFALLAGTAIWLCVYTFGKYPVLKKILSARIGDSLSDADIYEAAPPEKKDGEDSTPGDSARSARGNTHTEAKGGEDSKTDNGTDGNADTDTSAKTEAKTDRPRRKEKEKREKDRYKRDYNSGSNYNQDPSIRH